MTFQHSWIFDLSPEEKLRIIEELWDSLSLAPENVPIPDWHFEEVERRAERLKQDPTSTLTWEDIQRRIRSGHPGER